MKKLLTAALATGAAVVAFAAVPADARDGCGRGMHRGPYGRCHPDRDWGRDRVVVGTPGVSLVIGNYYRGQGYWDGRRYWQHRYRYNNGWRYR